MPIPEGCLYVVSARDDGRVVLSEIDERHPTGTAFIANSEGPGGEVERVPALVYRTPAVQQRIVQGAAVELGEADAQALLEVRAKMRAAQVASAAGAQVDGAQVMERLQRMERDLDDARRELRETQAATRDQLPQLRAEGMQRARELREQTEPETLEQRLQRLGGEPDPELEPSSHVARAGGTSVAQPPSAVPVAETVGGVRLDAAGNPVGGDDTNSDATVLDRSETVADRATANTRRTAASRAADAQRSKGNE